MIKRKTGLGLSCIVLLITLKPPKMHLNVSLSSAELSLFEDSEDQKPVFFDMKHSNNAARVRLWLKLKGFENKVDTNMLSYADLQSDEFARVNPNKKVPAFMTHDN